MQADFKKTAEIQKKKFLQFLFFEVNSSFLGKFHSLVLTKMKKIYIIVLCDFKRRKTQMRKSIAKLIIALLVIITSVVVVLVGMNISVFDYDIQYPNALD